MADVVKPKTFLKKGTRQFLSNATVRSQSHKPLTAENEEMQEKECKLVVAVRQKANVREQQQSGQQIVSFERKSKQQLHKFEQPVWSKENKTRKSLKNKQGKNKLEDYLGTTKAKFNSVVGLQRQDYLQEDQEDSPRVSKKESFTNVITKKTTEKPMANPFKNSQKKVMKPIVQIETDDWRVQEKRIVNKVEEQRIGNKVEEKKNEFMQGKANYQWDQPQEVKDEGQVRSKVLEKYYHKQPVIKQQIVSAKLTIKDIPNELKTQIFEQALGGRKQELGRKLEQLKGQIVAAKKAKEKHQEDNRMLAKEREQFNKEMEEKVKQFQQKTKGEVNKLTREKRYLKDQQTTGKADWRVKNELQEVKNALEEMTEAKKRIQVKSKGEIDRLKKKLDQQTETNKSLLAQIQHLQLNQVVKKQPQPLPKQQNYHFSKKQLSPKQNKKFYEDSHTNNEQLCLPSIYFKEAPKSSYIRCFLQDSFTLADLPLEYYNYENIEYYVYEQGIRDQKVRLTSEVTEGNKVSRVFEDGREEQHYASRGVLKRSYPFGFSLVHYPNQDLKLYLPEGIHVYYDARGAITEFTIAPHKRIYYFHNNHQAELKIMKGECVLRHQICDSQGRLFRTANGVKTVFQKNQAGKYVQVHK